VPHLLLWVLIFFGLAALAVRLITRSLDRLARAADRIGAEEFPSPRFGSVGRE